jgi:hypothetical protein
MGFNSAVKWLTSASTISVLEKELLAPYGVPWCMEIVTCNWYIRCCLCCRNRILSTINVKKLDLRRKCDVTVQGLTEPKDRQ